MAKIGEVIKGLNILSQYAKKGEEQYIAGFEHDLLISGIGNITSDNDAVSLKKYGWFLHEEHESWCIFS